MIRARRNASPRRSLLPCLLSVCFSCSVAVNSASPPARTSSPEQPAPILKASKPSPKVTSAPVERVSSASPQLASATESTPAPKAKPSAKPTTKVPAHARPAAPEPTKPPPALSKPGESKASHYTGKQPCRAKVFTFEEVRQVCATGGKLAAKRWMKRISKKAKKAGTRLKCTSCHTSLKSFGLTPNAVKQLRDWM